MNSGNVGCGHRHGARSLQRGERVWFGFRDEERRREEGKRGGGKPYNQGS